MAQTTDDVEVIEISTSPLFLNHHDSIQSKLEESGVQFSSAGGASALPVLNGMMGDRIQLLTDGAPTTAACGNQMNPPLSYVAANEVHALTVLPGVSPVSRGGDNIAGVIEVSTLVPEFSDSSEFTWQSGRLGYFYQSNDDANHLDAEAIVANDQWYIKYVGAQVEAKSYEDGNGNKVLDTLYKTQNHAVSAGYRDEKQRIQLSIHHQSIPYQGFPNQYMDMTDNNSTTVKARYERQFSLFNLDAMVSTRNVDHEMGFFSDEKTGMMPMLTESRDDAVTLHFDIPLDNGSLMRFGQEWFKNSLDDWWPAVEGSAMMGPNDYVNINDGERTRLAGFIEWQSADTGNWQYLAGARIEYVTTDTGEVQPYVDSSMSMMSSNVAAAEAFNAAERKQTDTLTDITLTATRKLPNDSQLQFGLAQKNRAPNLYERYTWGTSTMAMSMIGWFGDGNGYVGDINLKPETAHTVTAAYQIDKQLWRAEINAWYTDVEDYIDADVIGQFNSSGLDSGERNLLQFTNLDAKLMGASISAAGELVDNEYGRLTLLNRLDWQKGERKDDSSDLYQILPLQNRMTVQYEMDALTASLSWLWADSKTDVDARRKENTTSAYSVINLNTSYNIASFTFRFDIQNLLDEYYEQPLGGVNIAQFKADSSNGFSQIAGRGRSIDVGVTWQF
ncbi:TonB-dependent receptor [Alteromonas sp. C1M14]|nr:TonB-dependent receptor [Alteromonas sp. C1M14]MBU2977189.1 TonB-dependent receptor [Alteromonas sp. C1M14]